MPERSYNLRRGFSLLEMLVAVAILGIIGGLLYGTFSRSIESRDYATERAEAFATARACFDWLERDLAGSAGLGKPPAGVKRFFSPGTAGRPRLGEGLTVLDFTAISARGTIPLEGVALTPGREGSHGDQARIVYRLERDEEDGATTMVRYELRPLSKAALSEASRAVIVRGIESIEMRFFDGRSWTDKWDSQIPGAHRNKAPLAVQTDLVVMGVRGPSLNFSSAVLLPFGGSNAP